MQYSHILSYIGGKFYIAEWIISHWQRYETTTVKHSAGITMNTGDVSTRPAAMELLLSNCHNIKTLDAYAWNFKEVEA